MSCPPSPATITLACLADLTDPKHANCGEPVSGADIDWSRLIAFASAHFVLQAVPPALEQMRLLSDAPADARAFLDAVVDANTARNVDLRNALLAITGRLNAMNIVPVALKGAAFLLDEADTTAPWRFMSDLDLLVTEAELDASVRALRGLGFTPASDHYDPADEAHYPPLLSPCGTFSVELHTRLFGIDPFGLPVAEVRRDATPAVAPVAILRPTRAHRIVHVLSHAQLHNRNFAIHRLVLKDVLDLSQLTRNAEGNVDWAAVLGGFAWPADRLAAEALVAAWHHCTGAPVPALDPAAHQWARQAVRRLDRPKWRALADVPVDLVRMEAHRARRERGHWHRRFSLLVESGRLTHAVAHWTGKQRQRLWG